MERCINFEEFITNPGLCHIVNHFSSFLDIKSLAKCRLVCHSLKDLIDNDYHWLTFQVEHIHSQEKTFVDRSGKDDIRVKATISERFPEWKAFIDRKSRKMGIPRLKELVQYMWIYFKDDEASYNRNPLHHAVEKSDISFVQLLTRAGIDLSMRSPYEATPMHVACKFGSIEIVRFLIEKLPDFDSLLQTKDGWTIFHYAVESADPQVPRLVLNTFRFEDLRDEDGRTMIHDAIASGPKETVQFLLESSQRIGFDAVARDKDGSTILHVACRYRNIDIVNLVTQAFEAMKSGIDFNTPNSKQSTPLHFACINTTSDLAIHLLQRFPQRINEMGAHGMHILHYTCGSGNLDLLKYIFTNFDNIDFNALDEDGETPLHVASHHGQYETVKFLLENSVLGKIDISIKNNFQNTPEYCARQRGHNAIADLLDKYEGLLRIVQDLRSNHNIAIPHF